MNNCISFETHVFFFIKNNRKKKLQLLGEMEKKTLFEVWA